jgi:hypothetical protein
VHKHMDIHGYPDIQWIWIWSDIHAHGYFHGWGRARLMDLGMDLVLVYPSKPAPLPSLAGLVCSPWLLFGVLVRSLVF